MAPYYPHPPTPSSPSTPRRRTSGSPAHGGTTRTPADALAPDTLSFAGGVALCCADIIGSGIFASPGVVLHWCGSVGASLAMWILAGVISYVGFACLAELSVLDPNAGGLFYYFRTSFGPTLAFSWTFINFTVVVPGSLGALALTFAHYVASAIPGMDAGGFEDDADVRVKALACAAVATTAVLNTMSTSHSGGVAKVFLAATLGGCAFVFALGVSFACGAGGVGEYASARDAAARNFNPRALFEGTSAPANLGVGLVSALWAYAGAMDVASLGEELRDPERALPKVGTTGLSVVSAAYVAMNVAYLLVLPADVVDSSSSAAKDGGDAMGVTFARAVAGDWAANVVTVVVAMSSFGALNSCTLLSARQFYAAARDGLFPAALARTNARAAPHVAIYATALWTLALVFVMSSFATLVNYLSVAMWLYYGLVGVAVFVSRRAHPNARRPYAAPGYPVIPAVYVATCVYLSGCTFVAAPLPCAGALVFVAVAFPMHRACFARGGDGATTERRGDEGSLEPLLGEQGAEERDGGSEERDDGSEERDDGS